MGFIDKLLGNTSEAKLKKMRPIVTKINALEPRYQAMTDEELRQQTALFTLHRPVPPSLPTPPQDPPTSLHPACRIGPPILDPVL